MLEARELEKTYTMGKVKLTVLNGVSLSIRQGDFVGIKGPSGAGKSTLLHLLAGLDEPSAGEVCWKGQSLARMRPNERAVFRNETLGIVFQAYHLVPELNALENVMLPGVVKHGRRTAVLRDRAQYCLDQVGLSARSYHKPNALSGGELQRTAIARALMNEPKLLLCDEPTGNLDSKTGEEIVELLVALYQQHGVSLIIVTHQDSLAVKAPRVICLRDGQIVAQD